MDQGDLTMIAEGLERILADAQLENIDTAYGKGPEADALWQTLSDNGYGRLCVSEDRDGFGGSFADLVGVATLAGKHALPLPLVDTILTSGLLSVAGSEAPEMKIGLADPVKLSAPLAYAGRIDAVLTVEGGKLKCGRLDCAEVETVHGAEDGAGRVSSRPASILIEAVSPSWLSPEKVHALGALSRAAMMAGAMQAVLDLTLNYTQEREQFGRPLSKFQAIQHHLADIACETAAAIASIELASDAVRADSKLGSIVIDEIAIAKVRCGQAASRVAAASHQAHGAMGFTHEYALGRFTRRLWQWQDEFGSETEWAMQLGHAVLSESDPALWPRISQPI